MFFRKKKAFKDDFWKPEYNTLATYNSESARGIMHTPEWIEAMKCLQADYDERKLAYLKLEGITVIESRRSD